MSIRVQSDAMATEVAHTWYPETATRHAFGVLHLGSANMYLHETSDIDQIIAELVALKQEMAPPVITDSERTCPAMNDGWHCHRSGGHDEHEDDNGDRWRDDAQDTAAERICRPICGNRIPDGAWADGYRCCRECLSDQTTEALARYDHAARTKGVQDMAVTR